ncbi:hypothetical protein ACFQ4A_09195 [Lentibacillus salinarum]|uniref:Uncharacterized protein n=1 Tax=Lentibacillus salinarum TaxID=446820 RepID=A0ABW3ZVK3_9BACI
MTCRISSRQLDNNALQQVLQNLLVDMDLTMGLTGQKSVAERDRSMLQRAT